MPFRRLAVSMGAEVTMGEMMFSKTLLSGRNRSERARLRQAPNETCFGAMLSPAYVTCCLSADLALQKQCARGHQGHKWRRRQLMRVSDVQFWQQRQALHGSTSIADVSHSFCSVHAEIL